MSPSCGAPPNIMPLSSLKSCSDLILPVNGSIERTERTILKLVNTVYFINGATKW